MGMLPLVNAYLLVQRYYEKCIQKNHSFVREKTRLSLLNSYIRESDTECVNQLRMDKRTFAILCRMLRVGGKLKDDGLVSVEEQVCIFLHILAHHVKMRTIRNRFKCSSETISRYFNSVLNGVLRLQGSLLSVPSLVLESCDDERWKWFKGDIATNVLGVCDREMKFVFVFLGWEGLASDSRVLRDAISRPNGLKVPTGTKSGFLGPFRGTRYHLSEWQEGHMPCNEIEFFNMKHASARNVIECCFGLLKIRWAILRSPSFYPVKKQCRIITACCLLHNLIRREMSLDPMEEELDILEQEQTQA
ncbi:hypothetical protein UlMin_010734 [Ulmus minor]